MPAPAVSDAQFSLGNGVVQMALSGESGWYTGVAATVALDLVGSSMVFDSASNHQVAARLQRHGAGHRSVSDVLATLPQSSGFGLSGEDLERFEQVFDHDFGHVKIHTDGVAAEAARALNAYAFALGGDLYFGSGNFAPGTQKGDRLLAHELTHVVQHDENRLPAPSSGDEQVSSPSDPTEREAYANEKVIMGRLDRLDRVGPTDRLAEALPAAVEHRWSQQLGEAGGGGATEKGGLRDAANALGASAFLAEPIAAVSEAAVVQQRSNTSSAVEAADVRQEAKRGMETSGGKLPFWERIQAAFGRHDVSGIQSHTGGVAAEASRAIGARAYASGEDVVFGATPDLHTAAHEAAHVIQQRGGVSLTEGVGQVGDTYEQHADAVADAVVSGQSAEALLDRVASPDASAASHDAVQQVRDRALTDRTLEWASRMYNGEDKDSAHRAITGWHGWITSDWEPKMTLAEARQLIQNLKRHIEATETEGEAFFRTLGDLLETAAKAADVAKYGAMGVTALSGGTDAGAGATAAAGFDAKGKAANYSAAGARGAQAAERGLRRDSVRSEAHMQNTMADGANDASQAAEWIPIKAEIANLLSDRAKYEFKVMNSKKMLKAQARADRSE
jgi:hypothetical protein